MKIYLILFFSLSLLGDVVHIPLKLGSKWEYNNDTLTIMKVDTIGDTICYGFTTVSLPESISMDIWDSVGTWRSPLNNWFCVVETDSLVYFIRDTLASQGVLTLSNPLTVSKQWDTGIEQVDQAKGTPLATAEGTETITITTPDGTNTYTDCWKVRVEFYRKDTFRDIEYHFIDYTWFKDSVGIVKDSMYTEFIERDGTVFKTDARVLELQKYIEGR